MKFILLSLLLFTFNIFSQNINKLNSLQYYSILETDTFYFIMSNDKLLELSSNANSIFYYVDEISGNFNSSTIFSVNATSLALVNNDTLYIYSRNSEGEIEFMYKQPDIFNINKIFPWNNDFMISCNSVFKLLRCGNDSAYIADDSVKTDDGDQLKFPYFVKGRSIYNYIEGFGAYEVFYIPPEQDPGFRFLKIIDNYLMYLTWYQQYPQFPPSECSLKARKLEAGFPYLFNISYWGLEYYTYSWPLDKASNKYLLFGSVSQYKIYNYTPTLLMESFSTQFYPSNKYLFRLGAAIDFTFQNSGTLIFQPLEYYIVSDIDDLSLKYDFRLEQNYPNPFNPITNIKYSIPERSFVSIIIYDAMGKEISRLVNEEKQAGSYNYTFNGSGLSSGVYFYKISSGSGSDIKKMILLK